MASHSGCPPLRNVCPSQAMKRDAISQSVETVTAWFSKATFPNNALEGNPARSPAPFTSVPRVTPHPPSAFFVSASILKDRAMSQVNKERFALRSLYNSLVNVRIYRPVSNAVELLNGDIEKGLAGVFYHDFVMTGFHTLSEIKARFICCNAGPTTSNTPSNGFLFINNAFYVDYNEPSFEHVEALRSWCFESISVTVPIHHIHDFRLNELDVTLGHADLYVHDNACQHIIIFSRRCIEDNRPAPFHQSAYQRISLPSNGGPPICSNCTNNYPQWVVVGHARIDGALFCEYCRRNMLYDDNHKKIGTFSITPYGNRKVL